MALFLLGLVAELHFLAFHLKIKNIRMTEAVDLAFHIYKVLDITEKPKAVLKLITLV